MADEKYLNNERGRLRFYEYFVRVFGPYLSKEESRIARILASEAIERFGGWDVFVWDYMTWRAFMLREANEGGGREIGPRRCQIIRDAFAKAEAPK